MGILKTRKPVAAQPIPPPTKRRSVQNDLANLKPLKPGGALGFTGIREDASPKTKNGKGRNLDDMESDDEDDVDDKFADADTEDFKDGDFGDSLLSPEDAKKQGELAEGVKKIKVRPLIPLQTNSRY